MTKYTARHPAKPLPQNPSMRMKVYVWHNVSLRPGRLWYVGYSRAEVMKELTYLHTAKTMARVSSKPAVYRATALSMEFESYLNGDRMWRNRVFEAGQRLIAKPKPKGMKRRR
jgi:hypothetical protein